MAGSFRSALRNAAGAFVQLGEDPEILLEHFFADLEELVPLYDQQIHWLAEGLRLLDTELEAAETPEESHKATLSERAVLQRSYELALQIKRKSLQTFQDRCREIARTLPDSKEKAVRLRLSKLITLHSQTQASPKLVQEIQSVGSSFGVGPDSSP